MSLVEVFLLLRPPLRWLCIHLPVRFVLDYQCSKGHVEGLHPLPCANVYRIQYLVQETVLKHSGERFHCTSQTLSAHAPVCFAGIPPDMQLVALEDGTRLRDDRDFDDSFEAHNSLIVIDDRYEIGMPLPLSFQEFACLSSYDCNLET